MSESPFFIIAAFAGSYEEKNMSETFSKGTSCDVQIRTTKFNPNVSDEELKEAMDEIYDNNAYIGGVISGLSQKEFAESRQAIANRFYELNDTFKMCYEEILALRETTRRIEQERDEAVEKLAKILGLEHCEPEL